MKTQSKSRARWRSMRKSLSDRIGLKVFSLVVAAALYSMVSGTEDAQRSIFIDLIAVLPPPSAGKVLTSTVPDRIKLTVRGSKSLVHSLNKDRIRSVQIDLSDTSAPYFYFDSSLFSLPVGMEVVQIVPDSIPLTWEKKLELVVPIVPKFIGAPREGSAVKHPPQVTPPRVAVEGPEREIRQTRTVQTAAIDIAELGVGHYEREALLEPMPFKSLYRGAERVRVAFDIVEVVEQKQLRALPIRLPEHVTDLSLEPAQANVEIRGPKEAMTNLKVEDVTLWAEVLEHGPVRQPLLVPLRLRGLKTSSLDVRIDPPFATIAPNERKPAKKAR